MFEFGRPASDVDVARRFRRKLLETTAVTALVAGGFLYTAPAAQALPARFHLANTQPARTDAVMHRSFRPESFLVLIDDTTGNNPTSSGNENPTSSGSGENPTSSGSGENPTSSGSGENPTSSGSGENPTSSGSGENPTSSGSGENPTSSGSSGSGGGFATDLPGERVPQGGTITIGTAQSGSQGFGNEQSSRFAGDRDANAGDPNADRSIALAFGDPDPAVAASLGLALPAAREFWAWGRIYGTRASVFGNGGASYNGTGIGGAGGLETKPDKDSLIGLAFGIGHSHQKADAGDKGQLYSYRLGLYSQRYAGPVFFGATLNGAYNRGHAESAPDPLTGQTIEGSFGGYQVGVSVAGGYRFEGTGYAIEPWLGVEYERLHQNAFTLSGPGFADLHVDAVSLDTGRTRVGARFIKSLKIGDKKGLRLELQGGWSHDFLDVTPTVTQRIGTGASFVSTGTKTGRDAAFGSIGARLGLNEKVDLTLGVSGDARKNAISQSVTIGLRFKW